MALEFPHRREQLVGFSLRAVRACYSTSLAFGSLRALRACYSTSLAYGSLRALRASYST